MQLCSNNTSFTKTDFNPWRRSSFLYIPLWYQLCRASSKYVAPDNTPCLPCIPHLSSLSPHSTPLLCFSCSPSLVYLSICYMRFLWLNRMELSVNTSIICSQLRHEDSRNHFRLQAQPVWLNRGADLPKWAAAQCVFTADVPATCRLLQLACPWTWEAERRETRAPSSHRVPFLPLSL